MDSIQFNSTHSVTTVYGKYVVCMDEKAAAATAVEAAAAAAVSCSDSMIQRSVCAYFV